MGSAGQAGGAGGPGEGGEAGAAGAAGQGDGGKGILPLGIEGDPPAEVCTAQQLALHLSVVGGLPPYDWALRDVDASASLASGHGSPIDVSGVPLEAGTHQLEVGASDSAGSTVSIPFTLQVYETPEVVTSALHAACVNEAYRQTLSANGGDASSYRWSATVPANSSVSIAGSDLVATGPANSGPISVGVTVADDHCSSTKQLVLNVDSQCPRLVALPAPCLGQVYSQSIGVQGQGAQYTWHASVPPGIQFDEATHTLSGQILSASDVVVDVMDDLGHDVQRTYTLVPRDKCWLSYIAGASPGARLQLYDPILGDRRAFPASEPGDVTEFQFSPNGMFLAYVLAASDGSGASRIGVIDLADLSEALVDFAGASGADQTPTFVTAYAWSPDSTSLAVAFSNAAGTFIGGVDVSGVGSASSVPGASISAMTRIGATAAQVTSQIAWAGNSIVTFDAPSATLVADSVLGHVTRSASAFGAAVVNQAPAYASPHLQAVPMGVAMMQPTDPRVDLYRNLDQPSVTLDVFGDATLSPSSLYAARVVNGALQVFKANTFVNSASAPWAESAGGSCSTLLSWARDSEVVACLTEQTAGGIATGQTRIFQLPTNDPGGGAQPLTLTSTLVSNIGDYTESGARTWRRAFSPSGKWLALTTANSLYLVDVPGTSAWHTSVTGPVSGATDPSNFSSELAFSPSSAEDLLLWQRGSVLFLKGTNTSGYPLLMIAANLDTSRLSACEENFAGDPEHWCGNLTGRAAFSWSGDERFVAFRSAAGSLVLADLSLLPIVANKQFCDQACSPTFLFQP